MPVPAVGRDLHVDQALSNVVIGRRPSGFIADQFIPITPVDKQSDMYYKFRHGEWRRYEAGLTLRAPKTKAKKVHFGVASDTYYCHNYALGTDMAVEDVVNADAVLRWAESHAVFLADRLAMDYEFRIANFATTTANVGSVHIVTSGWQGAGSVPYSDLLLYKERFRLATGMVPNTMIIPQAITRHLFTNAQLRDILYGDRGGVATAQQLAGLIGIEKVLVPTAQVNTFSEVETENGSWGMADIWGSDSIWLAHTSTFAGFMTDTWINAFRWTNPLLGSPMAVERYPFDAEAKKFTMDVGYYQGEKVISSDLAMRIIVNSA